MVTAGFRRHVATQVFSYQGSPDAKRGGGWSRQRTSLGFVASTAPRTGQSERKISEDAAISDAAYLIGQDEAVNLLAVALRKNGRSPARPGPVYRMELTDPALTKLLQA